MTSSLIRTHLIFVRFHSRHYLSGLCVTRSDSGWDGSPQALCRPLKQLSCKKQRLKNVTEGETFTTKQRTALTPQVCNENNAEFLYLCEARLFLHVHVDVATEWDTCVESNGWNVTSSYEFGGLPVPSSTLFTRKSSCTICALVLKVGTQKAWLLGLWKTLIFSSAWNWLHPAQHEFALVENR